MANPKRIALDSQDVREMHTILWYSTVMGIRKRITLKSINWIHPEATPLGIYAFNYDYYLDTTASVIETATLSLKEDLTILRSKIEHIETLYPPIFIRAPYLPLISSMKFSKTLSGKKITDIINF